MSTQRYTPEFKDEAVRQVVERGYRVAEVAERLGVSTNSLHQWVKAVKPSKADEQAVELFARSRGVWIEHGQRPFPAWALPQCVRQARELATRARVDAEFVCSDVYGFVAGSAGPYDIVYTSYGAICWLPDLDRWAAVIASNLAPGGLFYMVEFHPIHDLLAGYSYFTRAEPDVAEEGSYTENGADVVAKLAVWAHPLSSVINALVGAGIRVERLNEFPFSPYNCFEGLVERQPGRFYLGHRGHDVPMVYSLTGRKVA